MPYTYNQGISPIAKIAIAIAISIFIKFGIAIAISIAIWKNIWDPDRDLGFTIADIWVDLLLLWQLKLVFNLI